MLDISFANEVSVKTETCFSHYSYRNASTGSSFAAFLAGYRLKRMQMAIPKITAMIAHCHEKMGTIVERPASGFLSQSG
jgi:hypothetical protein